MVLAFFRGIMHIAVVRILFDNKRLDNTLIFLVSNSMIS